jgi:hypothetical protein
MALAGPPNATKTRHNGIPGINSLDRVFNGALLISRGFS